jgi:FixJ family two-component response regulator
MTMSGEIVPVAKVSKGVVFVVDDDASVRRGLGSLFRSAGLTVEAFASAAEMEQSPRPESANCLVLDVRLPTLNGLELQEHLARSNRQVPIIFISGHADVPMTIRAMKGGAIDFFTKPVDSRSILGAVSAAIERDRKRRESEDAGKTLRTTFETLTPREREVMVLVTAGLMNKHIAAEMGLREITVKIHRGNIMRKMKAGSLPDLVRMADSLQLRRPRPNPRQT